MPIIPPKLRHGDGVRVIAPARSLAMPWITEELKQEAVSKIEKLGLKISFGEYVNEIDEFNSSSIENRIADLHAALLDDEIKLILTVIGGFNSNQLLNSIDYDLIKNHPKILCGYSDITALSNAIYAKTNMITYSGPHFFSFGDKKGFMYTRDYFQKCFFSSDPFEINPSEYWSDDRWAGDQENRTFTSNEEGFWVIQEGEAIGTIIGGNQCTFNLLQGTPFLPAFNQNILFLEDDDEAHVATIDRDLQSIIHQPHFEQVRGIVFGRFQPATGITRELLTKIVASKKELKSIPVIANADFGHTTPIFTFPIGGTAKIQASEHMAKLTIELH